MKPKYAQLGAHRWGAPSQLHFQPCFIHEIGCLPAENQRFSHIFPPVCRAELVKSALSRVLQSKPGVSG